jgi:hypothetical protein
MHHGDSFAGVFVRIGRAGKDKQSGESCDACGHASMLPLLTAVALGRLCAVCAAITGEVAVI